MRPGQRRVQTRRLVPIEGKRSSDRQGVDAVILGHVRGWVRRGQSPPSRLRPQSPKLRDDKSLASLSDDSRSAWEDDPTAPGRGDSKPLDDGPGGHPGRHFFLGQRLRQRSRQKSVRLRSLGRRRESVFWLNGAAQESNLPSRGLHDRTGFEDQLGHRPRPLRARH